MTIRYKSETFDLTTTNVTTILTCPSDATIIAKIITSIAHRAAAVCIDVDAIFRENQVALLLKYSSFASIDCRF
jgi:hypothetical protein